jgi:hypothetical protein
VPEELVSIPSDLTTVPDSELPEIERRARAEFDRLNALPAEEFQTEYLQTLMNLAEGIERLRIEIRGRDEKRQAEEARRQAADAEMRQTLAARVDGSVKPPPVTTLAPGEETQINTDGIAEAVARGMGAAIVGLLGERSSTVAELQRAASRSLSAAAQVAPRPQLPGTELTVQAGVDIPGIARGATLPTLDDLVGAFHRRARGMPVTNGSPREELVASIRHTYEHEVDDRTTPAQMEELLRTVRRPQVIEALLAGGGWCAPSEVLYNFFNVADAADGLIDLPTVGVTRGGIRFPVSPHLGDVYSGAFTNATNPWLWTEADDIATVTGGPNKPCVRVPCPTFSEVRLECYGICLTAGNLTNDAYPEATRHQLGLLLAAHGHAMNARIINSMVAASSAAISGGEFAGDANSPVTNQVLGAAELAATDYRSRYGMSDASVLEMVLPLWVRGAIRADLAHRNGVDLISVSDAQIAGYFADRKVRPQFVGDWQHRGSGQPGFTSAITAWPTSVNFMLYAAGTFVLGNGLSLDLGVTRDSVLNAENDFTAAWSEECHLVAKVGNESRLYTTVIHVNGTTGSANITADNL